MAHLAKILNASPAEIDLLTELRFNLETFTKLRSELATGAFSLDHNRFTGPIAPPRPEDIHTWPQTETADRVRWTQLGQEAIERGEVGVVILNGGMATRFGGVVKGIVEVVAGRSFLGLHLGQLARMSSKLPIFLMNSFATNAATQEHLETNDYFGIEPERVTLAPQRVSVRLSADGDLYRKADGTLSLYAPGHGDVFEVIGETDAFKAFCQRGGRYLAVCNVDNLGGCLHPSIIGFHLEQGAQATVEVVERADGERGGAPVQTEHGTIVLESFRFPNGFEMDQMPVFNTNTMVLDRSLFDTPPKLSWFRVDKTIGKDVVVQFERLMGEVSSSAQTTYLQVPRSGLTSRFLPVKTTLDLDALGPQVAARF